MENFAANVHIRASWNNLVDLPWALSSLLYNANISPQEVIVELELQSRQKCYVGWSGMNSTAPKSVEIDPIFAQSLKLTEKQAVQLHVKLRNYKATLIFLEPENALDWELVELHAAYMESKFIEQTRCIAVGQVLVVYPTKSSSVRLQVTDIGSPAHQYALIDPYAEISIAPKVRQIKKAAAASEKSVKSGRSSAEDTSHGPAVLKRGISIPHPLFGPELTLSCSGFDLIVNRSEFVHVFLRHDYVSVSVLTGPQTKPNKAPADANGADSKYSSEKSKESPVLLTETKLVVARLRNCPNALPNNVGLGERLAIALGVENKLGYKVVIRQAPRHSSKRPSTYVVHPYVTQTKSTKQLSLNSVPAKEEQTALAEKLSLYLFNDAKMHLSPISNYLRIPIIPDILPQGGLLTIKKRPERNLWIKPLDVDRAKLPKVEVEADLMRSASFIQDTQLQPKLETAYETGPVMAEIIEQISLLKNAGVMLYGLAGCGKTLVLKWAAKKCCDQLGYFVNFISCERLMNENQEALSATISKWFSDAVWHEPSLLVLDNLDKMLCGETENSDSRKANQISEIFVSHVERVSAQANTKVSLLITGISKESFNKQLILSHMVDNYVNLRAPDKESRAIIIDQYTLHHLGCKLGFDVMDLVQETKGYFPNDLKVLCERMYFQSLHLQQDGKSVVLPKSAFEKAHLGYTPSNLRGVKLLKAGASWKDIGGLTEAKRILLETLEWPTKYAPIFASCPLRLRSGILLYGYPGCGKTLLASAIAAQCGLNFISIKGPEILNKYIGASEQSVRDLFDRAQSAKPCILFFDEFDSIAPKRGHDSTGVTDRVVNQMLTQMDGAEGLDGVYVLAATSRPDLIDSALLRPGRLDKSVICDMPDLDDRFSILQCVCEKMDLEPKVDLNEIAAMSRGFSGADMQCLCYNAYLKAVHDKLSLQEQEAMNEAKDTTAAREFFHVTADKLTKLRPAEQAVLRKQVEKIFEGVDTSLSDKEPKKTASPVVLVSQDHFLASLKETKPSISASETNKLRRIYSEFVTGRSGNMPDGSASNNIGGRTTLM